MNIYIKIQFQYMKKIDKKQILNMILEECQNLMEEEKNDPVKLVAVQVEIMVPFRRSQLEIHDEEQIQQEIKRRLKDKLGDDYPCKVKNFKDYEN